MKQEYEKMIKNGKNIELKCYLKKESDTFNNVSQLLADDINELFNIEILRKDFEFNDSKKMLFFIELLKVLL